MSGVAADKLPIQAGVAVRVGRAIRRLPWRALVIVLSSIALTAYVILPFWFVVLASVMTPLEATEVPPHWIPNTITLDNYLYFANPNAGAIVGGPVGTDPTSTFPRGVVNASVRSELPRSVVNSLIISVLVVVTNMLIALPAAYAFVRLRFGASKWLLLIYLTSRMVPSVAIIVPLYIWMTNLGFLNTRLGPVIAITSITLPFSIWILMNYLQTIPQELEDAARVDRCTRIQAVRHVVLPVALPAITASSMFVFMSAWGEFLLSSTLTQTADAWTVTTVLANMSLNERIPITISASAAVISMAPPIIMALLFQRILVKGLTTGSVKG